MSEYSEAGGLPCSSKSSHEGKSRSCKTIPICAKMNFHVNVNELTDDEIDLSGAEMKFILEEITKFAIEEEKRDLFLKDMTVTLENNSKLLELKKFYPEDFHDLYLSDEVEEAFFTEYIAKNKYCRSEWKKADVRFDEKFNTDMLMFALSKNSDFDDITETCIKLMHGMCQRWSALEISALKKAQTEKEKGDRAKQGCLHEEHNIIKAIFHELFSFLTVYYEFNGIITLNVKSPYCKNDFVAKPDLMIPSTTKKFRLIYPAIVVEVYGPDREQADELSPALKKRKMNPTCLCDTFFSSPSLTSWCGVGFESSEVGVIGRPVSHTKKAGDEGIVVSAQGDNIPIETRMNANTNNRESEVILHGGGDIDNTPLTKEEEDSMEIKQSTPIDDKPGPRKHLTEIIKACPDSLSSPKFQTARSILFGQHVLQMIGCGQQIAQLLLKQKVDASDKKIEMIGLFVVNTKVYVTKCVSTMKYWMFPFTSIDNYEFGDDKLNYNVSNWNLDLGKKKHMLALMAFILTYERFLDVHISNIIGQ